MVNFVKRLNLYMANFMRLVVKRLNLYMANVMRLVVTMQKRFMMNHRNYCLVVTM